MRFGVPMKRLVSQLKEKKVEGWSVCMPGVGLLLLAPRRSPNSAPLEVDLEGVSKVASVH